MGRKKKNNRFPVGKLKSAVSKKAENGKLSPEEEELVNKSKRVKTLQRQLNRLKKLVGISVNALKS